MVSFQDEMFPTEPGPAAGDQEVEPGWIFYLLLRLPKVHLMNKEQNYQYLLFEIKQEDTVRRFSMTSRAMKRETET